MEEDDALRRKTTPVTAPRQRPESIIKYGRIDRIFVCAEKEPRSKVLTTYCGRCRPLIGEQ